MTTLTLSPVGLDVSLTLSLEDAPDMVLELTQAPQPEITLDLTAGLPPAAPDLEPVLEAIAALPRPQATNLDPVLEAIAAIPAPAPTDLTPTLDAIAAIPVPDVAGKLTEYGAAKQTHIAEAVAVLQAAINAMPVPDVTGSLTAYNAAKASDLVNALATLQEAIAGVVKTAHLDEVTATLAKAADLAALIATTGTLATKDQLANVQAAVLAAIAAIPPAVMKNQVVDVALDANGQVPVGYALVNGIPALPSMPVLGGLLTYLGVGKGAPPLNTACGRPIQRGNGDVLIGYSATIYAWNSTTGYGGANAALPAHPGSGSVIPEFALLPSGRLLSASTSQSNAPATLCYAGNFSTFTWNAVAPLPVARCMGSLTTLKDGRVVCIGGSSAITMTAASAMDRLETFDEPSNTWTLGPVVPVKGAGQSVLLPDGRVLYMPSRISDGTTLSLNTTRLFIYDPVAVSWVETDALPAGSTMNANTVLVADDAGALLVYVDGPQAACRYTAGNAAGARWSLVHLDCIAPVASIYRGGFGVKLSSGQVYVPRDSSHPQLVAVQFNPGNQIVQARKL